jgi:hypothetical protein
MSPRSLHRYEIPGAGYQRDDAEYRVDRQNHAMKEITVAEKGGLSIAEKC